MGGKTIDHATPFRYSAFGLDIASAMPLPELRAGSEGDADVIVRRAALPPPPATSRRVGTRLAFGDDEVRLEIADLARFAIRGGREIIVDADMGTSDADIRCYLLGSVFAILLHQRGRLPLHASAVAIDGRAILFMGVSGAGKSTLAQHLQACGGAMISDDLSVVDADPIGVWPGVTAMKLWRESLAFAGRSPDGLTQVHYADDKFQLPATTLAPNRCWPIAGICVLGDEGEAGLSRLDGRAGVAALFSHTFRGMIVREIGRSAHHLAQCIAIARTIPIFSWRRRWGLDYLATDADRLLEEFAQRAL